MPAEVPRGERKMLETLFVLAVAFGLFVLLPLLLLKVLLGFVLWLVLLPFKLLGALFKVGLGAIGVFAKVCLSGIGVLLALVGLAFFVVLLPLLPLVVGGLLIYLVIRAFRPAPAPARVV